MNVLILGGGPEELAWAVALAPRADDRLLAAYPGFPDFEEVPRPRDLDDALAVADVDTVIVGGAPAFRAEALRRAAAEGFAVIVGHPPGDDSEAYYLVSLSRVETGAVIVPDLPARLHPGVSILWEAIRDGRLGSFRGLRYEETVKPEDGDLARHAFARAVDLVRSLLGDVEALTATGDPLGDRPTESLIVQLRGPNATRAEVRLTVGAGFRAPAKVVVSGSDASLTLEYDDAPGAGGRLVRLPNGGSEAVEALPSWDAKAAILGVLASARAGESVHPDLADGIRATEVAEAVVRSLRRGRTVELHYEEVSEAGTFKSVMTSFGCLILFSILVVLPVALGGPAIGIGWTIYIAYLIPPVLLGFLILQLLNFATRRPEPTRNGND